MEIIYTKSSFSTQEELKEKLKTKKLSSPVAYYTLEQTKGIGSRGNSWIGLKGNLFLSFAVAIDTLPKDLKLESASIYFATILKEVLASYGSKIWIKWPNDFYLEKKVGGMVTTIVKNDIICGVGLNVLAAPEGFESLDIQISPHKIVEKFIESVEKFPSWKQVFRKYSVEFYKNKNFFTHLKQEEKVSLADAILQNDGSIMINNERIYSLR